MPATTALDIITDAFVTIGVTSPDGTLDPSKASQGLRRLNQFVGGLALQPLTIPVVAREVFPLTSEVGVYTIGNGGDFDTERPIALTGASILLNNNLTPIAVTSITRAGVVATVTTTADHGASTGQNATIAGAEPAAYNGTFPITVTGLATFTYIFPGAATSAVGTITALIESNATDVVEIPAPVITDDAYQWNQIKSLTSPLVTWVYYSPTFQGDLGTIQLWPIPTVTTNALVLYRRQQLRRFASLSATYYLPEGAEEVFHYGLAKRLLTPFAVTDADVVEDVRDMARASMGIFKRGNNKLRDLPTDPALTHSNDGGYNIITGMGGGG